MAKAVLSQEHIDERKKLIDVIRKIDLSSIPREDLPKVLSGPLIELALHWIASDDVSDTKKTEYTVKLFDSVQKLAPVMVEEKKSYKDVIDSLKD